jgi:hypothetical protein
MRNRLVWRVAKLVGQYYCEWHGVPHRQSLCAVPIPQALRGFSRTCSDISHHCCTPPRSLWREIATKGVAYRSHLYTRIASGVQTDEIEKWLNAEFETPADGAIAKATSGARLSPSDWGILVRFLAAQDIRTPARLMENLQRWKGNIQPLLDQTLRESVRQYEAAKSSGQAISIEKSANSEYIPLHVTSQIEPGKKFGAVKAEVIVGRSLWLFTIRHALTTTINVLHKHRWTILSPPDGLTWFTSDDPVIRLNYSADRTYNFEGGWGSAGTEIFLPLDPRHLLYTQVGKHPPRRGSIVPHDKAEMIRRFIAEHAHRYIFAASPDADVPSLRPRIANAALLADEREQWRKWHEDQTTAEQQLDDSRGATG